MPNGWNANTTGAAVRPSYVAGARIANVRVMPSMVSVCRKAGNGAPSHAARAGDAVTTRRTAAAMNWKRSATTASHRRATINHHSRISYADMLGRCPPPRCGGSRRARSRRSAARRRRASASSGSYGCRRFMKNSTMAATVITTVTNIGKNSNSSTHPLYGRARQIRSSS